MPQLLDHGCSRAHVAKFYSQFWLIRSVLKRIKIIRVLLKIVIMKVLLHHPYCLHFFGVTWASYFESYYTMYYVWYLIADEGSY